MRKLLRRLRRIPAERREAAQVKVLDALARAGELHGPALYLATKMSYPRLYTALNELENRKLITARPKNTEPYPRLRLYRLAGVRQDKEERDA